MTNRAERCPVPSCSNKKYVRGVCQRHYHIATGVREATPVEVAISKHYLLEPYAYPDDDPFWCICSEPVIEKLSLEIWGAHCIRCHKPPKESLSTVLMTEQQKEKIHETT